MRAVSEPGGERLAVFGGAFDPPHVGHAIVAQDVWEVLSPDRLLIVPAARPPHRDTVFPAERRLRWVRRLFEGEPGLEVTDMEYRRAGPSYTVDTLARIREERGPVELLLVIGADQLRVISGWHEHERIPELADLVVMDRGGNEPTRGEPDSEQPEAAMPHTVVEVTRIDLSSTRVRERLRAGRSIRFLVPEVIRADVEAAWARGEGNVPRSSGYS